MCSWKRLFAQFFCVALRCLNETLSWVWLFCTQCSFELLLSIWSIKAPFYAKLLFRGKPPDTLTRALLLDPTGGPDPHDYSQNVQYLIFLKICPNAPPPVTRQYPQSARIRSNQRRAENRIFDDLIATSRPGWYHWCGENRRAARNNWRQSPTTS